MSKRRKASKRRAVHSNKFVEASVVRWCGVTGVLIEAVKHGQKMPSDFLSCIKQNRVSSVMAFDELSIVVHATLAELKAFVKRVEADERVMRKQFLGPGQTYIRHFSSDLCFVLKAK